mmetsp:Transcript_23247/g.71521  ORF Transcript_23247/g.71521 Transcript_23247/m.71521 type:complete len:984 (+) Transcript_23247:27-2978(+)
MEEVRCRPRAETELKPKAVAPLQSEATPQRPREVTNPLMDLGERACPDAKLRDYWEAEDAAKPTLLHELRCFYDAGYRLVRLREALAAAMRERDVGANELFEKWGDRSLEMSKTRLVEAIREDLGVEMRLADVDQVTDDDDVDEVDVATFHDFVFSTDHSQRWRANARRTDAKDDCNDLVLLRRDMLRYDPVVLNLLRGFWCVADKDGSGFLDESEYVDYHMHLYASLNVEETRTPGWQTYARRNAIKEWQHDTAGRGDRLDQYRFHISLFQIVDAYVGGEPDKEKVAKFLCFLLDLVTLDTQGDATCEDRATTTKNRRRVVFRWEVQDDWLEAIDADASKVSSNSRRALDLEERIENGASKMLALAPDLRGGAKQKANQKSIDVILDRINGTAKKPQRRKSSTARRRFSFMATTIAMANKQRPSRGSLGDAPGNQPPPTATSPQKKETSPLPLADRLLKDLARTAPAVENKPKRASERRRVKSLTDAMFFPSSFGDPTPSSTVAEPPQRIEDAVVVDANVILMETAAPMAAPADLDEQLERSEDDKCTEEEKDEEVEQQVTDTAIAFSDGDKATILPREDERTETPAKEADQRPTARGDALVVTRMSRPQAPENRPRERTSANESMSHQLAEEDEEREGDMLVVTRVGGPQAHEREPLQRERNQRVVQNASGSANGGSTMEGPVIVNGVVQTWARVLAQHIGETRPTPSFCKLQALFLCDTTSSIPALDRTNSKGVRGLEAPRVIVSCSSASSVASAIEERMKTSSALQRSHQQHLKRMSRPQTAQAASASTFVTLKLEKVKRRPPSALELSAIPGFLLMSKSRDSLAPTPAEKASVRRRSLTDLATAAPVVPRYAERETSGNQHTSEQKSDTATAATLPRVSLDSRPARRLLRRTLGDSPMVRTSFDERPRLSSLGDRPSSTRNSGVVREESVVKPIWESSVFPIRRPSTAFSSMRNLPMRSVPVKAPSKRRSRASFGELP